MKTLARLLAVLLMLLLAIGLLRHFTPGYASARYLDAMDRPFSAPEYDLVATTTTLAFILIGAWLTGKVFKLLHLPRITGYLAFGLLIGPSFITLFTAAVRPLLPHIQMEHLRMFTSLAIALIGLTAGGEIKVELLRRGFARVLTITLFEMLGVFAAVFTLLAVAGRFLPFFSEIERSSLLVASSLLSVVAISNSPAVAVALLSETRAQGPMAETCLAVTVCKDLLVVILFTLTSGIGYGLLHSEAGAAVTPALFAELAWHLLGSMTAGAILGWLMSTVLHHLHRQMSIFVLAVALAIGLFSDAVGLEPLLVSLTAGFVLSNIWPGKSERLFHSIEELSVPVYCIFFAMAGAKIDLQSLLSMWPIAGAIVIVRVAAVWSSTTFACRLTGVPAPARTWMWTALIPQAGVSIALASSVAVHFADFEWGPTLASLLLATIAMFECFGPILFRHGLVKSGETSG